MLDRLDKTFMHGNNVKKDQLKEKKSLENEKTITQPLSVQPIVPKVPFIITTVAVDLDTVTVSVPPSATDISTGETGADQNVDPVNSESVVGEDVGLQEGAIMGAAEWLEQKRTGRNLFFVVVASSRPAWSQFSQHAEAPSSSSGLHLHKDQESIESISAIDPPYYGGKTTRMDSHPFIDQIRWSSRDMIYGNHQSDTQHNPMLKEEEDSLDEVTKKRKLLSKAVQFDVGGMKGKRTKEKSPSYEVLWGTNACAMYSIPIRHSKDKKFGEDAATLLKPLNEYEIYAPLTLQERQQKMIK